MRPFGLRIVAVLALWLAAGFLLSLALAPAMARAAAGTKVDDFTKGIVGDSEPPAWADVGVRLGSAALAALAIGLSVAARTKTAAGHSGDTIEGDRLPE